MKKVLLPSGGLKENHLPHSNTAENSKAEPEAVGYDVPSQEKRQRAVGYSPSWVTMSLAASFCKAWQREKISLFRNTVGKTLTIKNPMRKCVITDSASLFRLDPQGIVDPEQNGFELRESTHT